VGFAAIRSVLLTKTVMAKATNVQKKHSAPNQDIFALFNFQSANVLSATFNFLSTLNFL